MRKDSEGIWRFAGVGPLVFGAISSGLKGKEKKLKREENRRNAPEWRGADGRGCRAENMGDAMMEAQGQAAEGKAVEGKAAVRLYLINRLEAAGLVRTSKQSKGAFEAGKLALVERLAYMSADGLRLLAEAIIESWPGRDWPTEKFFLQAARSIEPPPVTENRALSWIESVEGPKAVARGDLVEIFRFIMSKRRPPHSWEMQALAEEARTHARQLVIVAEMEATEAGARADQRQWRDRYLADQADAMALVEKGNARRAGQS